MTRRHSFAVSTAVLTMLGACGAAEAQGFLNIDEIPGLPDQPSLQLDLDAALLGFAAGAADVGEPEIADLLESIEGARVRIYPTLEDPSAVTSFVEDASGRLAQDGWNRVFYAENGDDTVRVFARLDGLIMNGLTIMALNENEAVFVDVAGRISAAQLGRIVETMGAVRRSVGR